MVHCDIKLDNFAVDKNNFVKIIDFGGVSEYGTCPEEKYFYRPPELN
jgi:serine/threonine protein kinase